jgi:Zn-finger nucleic acid-binding protein
LSAGFYVETPGVQCPIDGETLIMTERSGVEIDYCPKCRGVWLDRGELDKIIERSGFAPLADAPPRQASPRPEHFRDEDDHDWKYRKDKRYKRESFLSDLFDF